MDVYLLLSEGEEKEERIKKLKEEEDMGGSVSKGGKRSKISDGCSASSRS